MSKIRKEPIEPDWFLEYLSDFRTRQARYVLVIIILAIGPFIFYISFITIFPTILNEIMPLIKMIISYIALGPILYFACMKYIVNRNLNLDKYSMLSYYSGNIGLELARLGFQPSFNHEIDFLVDPMRKCLFFVALDYHGDFSAKRKKLFELRKRLKSLPVLVKENNNLMLSKKFFDFGECISKDDCKERIKQKCLEDLLTSLPKSRPNIFEKSFKLLNDKTTIIILCLFFGLVLGVCAYFILHFTLYESLTIALIGMPIPLAIFAIKK